MHAVLYDRQGYIKWGGRSEPSPQNAQLPPQNDDIKMMISSTGPCDALACVWSTQLSVQLKKFVARITAFPPKLS